MALPPGARIGVYDITASIGEGGMGQVYRATDTTLGRQVAIKILPEAFASDPDRMSRFEREAKTLDHRQTWPLTADGGQVVGWRNDGREILVATLSGHIAAYPVTTDGVFSHGEPTTLVRNLGGLAAYTVATPDHGRMLIRVRPEAAEGKGEMRLLFGWQDGLRQP